jgi:hypothetical protein
MKWDDEQTLDYGNISDVFRWITSLVSNPSE